MTWTDYQTTLNKKLGKLTKNTLAPPPKLTLSEWASRYLNLPASAAYPGRFRFDRAEFQRGVFDALSDPTIKKVVINSAAQMLKTQAMLAYIGYIIHLDPAPILNVQPIAKLANAFSKDRIDTMIADCPVLSERVQSKRNRDGGNTKLHKEFPGGALTIALSNSVSDLAARPIRYLLCDEVDRYEITKEGDPVELAEARTTTFWNSKVVLVSTPTDEGLSRIDKEYQASDRRIFVVPCHECGAEQELKWRNVKWSNRDHRTAHIECSHCNAQWTEADRINNVQKGRWIITNPESEVAGFHISALYSGFITLSELVKQFLNVKDEPSQLKTFINTRLAETWKSDAAQVKEIKFLNRLEKYDRNNVPEQVLLVTCGVDVQIDRLEAEIVGWGKGEESWGIHYVVLHGDTSSPAPWQQLADIIKTPLRRVDGVPLRINATCVDTGGTATEKVFAFAREMARWNVMAIKGQSGAGRPVFPKKAGRWAGSSNAGNRFYSIGTDTAKEQIYTNLLIEKAGPSFCHFPTGYDEVYFDGLTAEKYMIKYKHGYPYKYWYKKDSDRNEPLDCRVYALAARYSFMVDWDAREKALKAKANTVEAVETPEVEKDPITQTIERRQEIAKVVADEQKKATAPKPVRSPRRNGGGYVSGMGL